MEDTLDIKAVNDLIRLAEASIEEALDVTNHHQSKEHVKELQDGQIHRLHAWEETISKNNRNLF